MASPKLFLSLLSDGFHLDIIYIFRHNTPCYEVIKFKKYFIPGAPKNKSMQVSSYKYADLLSIVLLNCLQINDC